MRCAACSQDNLPGARFCSGCGGGLERICLGCGHASGSGAQFCSACGRILAPGVAAPEDRAVSWLKGHRLRARLGAAVRTWQRSLPTVGLAAAIDPQMMAALEASPAVAGSVAPVGLASQPNQLLERLLRKSATSTRLGARPHIST